MFGRKKREYAQQSVVIMHQICPTGDKALTEAFAENFSEHFEAFRQKNQPIQAPAVGIPMSLCARIYELTSIGKHKELEVLDPWKEWIVTLVDVLLYDEPYASEINEMYGENYKAQFEQLKTYPAEIKKKGGGEVDTYGDLITRGRLRMDMLKDVLGKLEDPEKNPN